MTHAVTSLAEPLGGPTGRVVTARRDELRRVLREHGIVSASVFGSVARGDDHEGSDLDLLVDVPSGTSLFDLLRIQAELEAIVGVEVDLIPTTALKERVRRQAEPDLITL